MGKASDWKSYDVETKWAAGCGGGLDFVFAGRFIVAKKRWAGDALGTHGVENPSAWARHEVQGTNIVVFVPCPYDREAMLWRPDFLAKQRAYQEELNGVLDSPAKAPRKRKEGRA